MQFAERSNSADFNDQVWLDSFYTFDGKDIAVLAHTEYHGWAIEGECNVQGNNQYAACEYDSDTFHFSRDGGYHFHTPEVPKNFLAGFPNPYLIDDGPMGYNVDTNIVKYGGWFYAVATNYTGLQTVWAKPGRTRVWCPTTGYRFGPKTFSIRPRGAAGAARISR
jgi:hypothetical protein